MSGQTFSSFWQCCINACVLTNQSTSNSNVICWSGCCWNSCWSTQVGLHSARYYTIYFISGEVMLSLQESRFHPSFLLGARWRSRWAHRSSCSSACIQVQKKMNIRCRGLFARRSNTESWCSSVYPCSLCLQWSGSAAERTHQTDQGQCMCVLLIFNFFNLFCTYRSIFFSCAFYSIQFAITVVTIWIVLHPLVSYYCLRWHTCWSSTSRWTNTWE